jgi:hypothetical protein
MDDTAYRALTELAHEMDMELSELLDEIFNQLDDHDWEGGLIDPEGVCEELNMPTDQHNEHGLAAVLNALPLPD